MTTISPSRLVTSDVSDDEERLRELLRAPLDDAAPVRIGAVHPPLRMPRAATITLVVAVVAFIVGAVALFGMVTDRSRPVAGRSAADRATGRPRTDSLIALARAVPCDVHRPVADPAQLRTFHPVVGLRCDVVVRASGVVRTRAVSGGPFGALIRDLERPDGVEAVGGACGTYSDAQPRVFLVDAAGHYVRLRFPRDGCGLVHGTSAYDAYRRLTWIPVRRTR